AGGDGDRGLPGGRGRGVGPPPPPPGGGPAPAAARLRPPPHLGRAAVGPDAGPRAAPLVGPPLQPHPNARARGGDPDRHGDALRAQRPRDDHPGDGALQAAPPAAAVVLRVLVRRPPLPDPARRRPLALPPA